MKKASDLKIPFVWADRHPVILEKCLYIPSFYSEHEQWKILPWEEIFGRTGKVKIEFCSGNGQWICEKAKQEPDVLWVAVEKLFDRAKKIWARLFRENINNLFVVCGAAESYIRHYVPHDSVDEVFVNFPDPWPKLRHAKHRLIQKAFMDDLAKIVRKEGSATFVTDDEAYRDWMLRETAKSPDWRNELGDKGYTSNWSEYGNSWFFDFWVGRGKQIYYQRHIHD